MLKPDKMKQVDFHAQVDDLFATQATKISLIRQTFDHNPRQCKQALERMEDELMYLQERYRLTTKR